MKLLFPIALAIVTFVSPSFAGMLTVHPDGPPSYDYSTISEALDAASSGDTIEIYNGIYREAYSIESRDKNWDNVTIKAAAGQTEVYWQNDNANYAQTGGSRWSAHSGNVYRSNADFHSGNVWTVFYEHPSSGAVWRLKPENSLAAVDSNNEFYHDTSNGVVYVRLTDQGLGVDPDSYIMRLGNTAPGGATLFFKLNGTRGIDNITIDGITFRFCGLGGSPYYMGAIGSREEPGQPSYNLTNLTIQNCTFRYNGARAISMNGVPGDSQSNVNEGPDNVLIKNCIFDDNGGYIYAISQAHHTIGNGYGVISETIQDCTFDNAFRHHIAWMGPDSGGIPANKRLIVERSVILGGKNYAEIWDLEDSAGFRLPKNGGEVIIRNNIVAGMGYAGIWVQASGPNIQKLRIYNNTFAYNCQVKDSTCSNIRINNEVDEVLEIKGNVIWGSRRGRTSGEYLREIHIASTLPGTGADIDYNIVDREEPGANSDYYPVYYNGAKTWDEWRATKIGGEYPDEHSIGESFSTNPNYPQFVNNKLNGSGNYHIQATSPCIDMSLPGLVTFDVDKERRGLSIDIGADEYTGKGDTTPPEPPGGIRIE